MKKGIWRGVVVSTASLIAAAQAFGATYSNFAITGNSRIQDSVILGVAGLRQGQAVSDAEVNAAIQRMYASGLFADIQATTRGNTVTFRVAENGVVSGVYFEGNRKVDDEVLASVVTLGPRDGLDRPRIQEEIQNIKRVYASRSRFDVDVNPVVIPTQSGTYKLVFEIDEGSVSEIERINFTGNNQVTDWTLRRVIDSREAGLFSNLFSADNFANEKLQSDEQRLLDYYQNNGYYNVKIRAAQADYDAGGNFFLTYAINEGQRYNFGNVGFRSEIAGVNAQDFTALSKLRMGRVYDRSRVRDTIEAIEEEAEARGLPFLRAVPEVTVDETNATVNIDFRLVNADRVFVERIDIHGNETTLDRVIRRHFDTAEGDPLNERKLTEARQAIEGTGFFTNVAVSARDGSAPDKKIIDVEVAEGSTGSLSFGGGYSDGSWGLNVNFSERNFLGRGQFIELNVDYSKDNQTGRFSFTEPALFGRPGVSGGFDIYYQSASNTAAGYSSKVAGFEPRLSFPVTDDSRLSVSYFLKQNKVDTFADDASPLITAERGEYITSGMQATWVWDNTDNQRDATRGWIVRLGAKYAGIGGDDQWVQFAGKAKYFRPFWSERLNFSAEIEGGTISGLDGQDVSVRDRFFLGGSNGLKGFKPGGLGPRDFTSTVNSSLGGNNYAAVRTQVTFPLGLPEELGLKGGAFWEAGSVWGLDNTAGAMGIVDDSQKWRATRGLSLIWSLGAQTLSFNINDPYRAESYDETEDYSVSFVTRF